MKLIRFIFIGILFGIIMTKSEAVSWYRIQEMFRFQSFHMYGIIGTALFVGVIMSQFIKRKGIKTIDGLPITIEDKEKGRARYLYGGIIFGLGWALSGACPGPLYTMIGAGYPVYIVILMSAVVGALFYGMLKDHLPH